MPKRTTSTARKGFDDEALPRAVDSSQPKVLGLARGATDQPSLWFSPNPRKRAIEEAWVKYTVVWCSVMGVVMLTGLGSYWHDLGLMILGVVAMIGTYVFPIYFVDRKYVLHFPTLNAMFFGNCALSFTMHYIATPFFFDVLHMRYGFKVTMRIDRNPIFLYFLTVAYFATYSVLSCICLRRCLNAFNTPFWKQRPTFAFLVKSSAVALVPFGVALGETLMNANPFIAELFCYDDNFFALTFGTFAYGIGFVFSIPIWMYAVPDEPQRHEREGTSRIQTGFELFFSSKSRLWHNVFGQLLAEALHGVVLYYLRHDIAPMFTTVVENSGPFGGCLAPPRFE